MKKNKGDLSESDVARYEKQIELINVMCKEMENYKEGSPNDALLEKTHEITKELERLGPLPKEVLGMNSLPNLANPMASGGPIPEMPKDCCIM